MTQQDETGPGTVTGNPAPADEPTPLEPPPPPSPYLDATGSPQAYLAPPRPDQPRYGTPTAYRPSPRSLGRPQPGQQDYGQPGYTGQGYADQGYPNRRYGRPANARGAFVARSRRDPAIAAPWERLIASILDWILIFTASVLAFLSPLEQIWHDTQAIGARYPSPYSPAARAAIASIQKDPATKHTLLFWLLAMFGIALVYYWVQHAAWGATIGKRLLGMRVVTSDRSPIGVWAAGLRACAFLVGPAICVLPTVPLLLSIVGELLWLADTGMVVFDSRARCLHDKLAGTIVIRQRWLDQQARSTRPW